MSQLADFGAHHLPLASDKEIENPVHWNDFHATVLRLFGIDHERLTYYHNGIRRRLTNVRGEAIQKILACKSDSGAVCCRGASFSAVLQPGEWRCGFCALHSC